MKKVLKWTGLTLLALIVMMTIYGFLGKDRTLKLNIGPVDLSQIPDGGYIGIYDCYRWSNTVEVTVGEHKITDIRIIKEPSGREDMTEELKNRVLNVQNTNVDVISGATASSKAFLKAVENALIGTGKK